MAVAEYSVTDSEGSWTRQICQIRHWPLFTQSSCLIVFIATVVTCDLILLAIAVPLTPILVRDLWTFAAFLGGAAVCVEAMRRLGSPAGVSRDLLGAWWLPALLLLPPVYSLLFPIPIYILLQFRIRRAVTFRRVFNAASVALSGFASSSVFHAVMDSGLPFVAKHGDGSTISEETVLTSGSGVAVAVVCCALFTCIHTAVMSIGVRLSAPETPWRGLLWDGEAALTDGAELCVGIMVAILCGLSLLLLAVALPPVLLLQRGLLFQQLQTAARTDPKTGLLNAATWEGEADAELSRALQSGRPMAVLIIDIDHFKKVNDTHGHLFGDQVLLGVANTLTHQLDESDIIGRFGGEEFVVLLPGADTAKAHQVAERLRARVGRMALPTEDATVTITISIGVALLLVHGRDLLELLTAADLALYHAKDTGRDRVCLPNSPGDGDAPLSEDPSS
ncbi:sensor domain-containing diguanylate cyclase [Salinactinospora qingdaonensis]|uniref:GGDEF domain-containing protein n=1 Tax=Salinactinospora qingdaonensis TaxID=702744 RepID=A0ABP7EUG6_9ACTN